MTSPEPQPKVEVSPSQSLRGCQISSLRVLRRASRGPREQVQVGFGEGSHPWLQRGWVEVTRRPRVQRDGRVTPHSESLSTASAMSLSCSDPVPQGGLQFARW